MKTKKLLTVLLCLLMTANISAAGADATRRTPLLKNGEVDKMYSFGLIRDPHVFETDSSVTRGEAAYAFDKMVGYDTAVDKKKTPVADTDKNVNETAIYKVYSLGIMPCVYGTNFMPDKAVSYGDVLRGAARLLGYNETVLGENADFQAYLRVMINGGAVKNVVKAENDSVSWAEFLSFLDTVLEASLCESVPVGDHTEIRRTDENILNDRLNIYECRGVMTKNNFSSLSGDEAFSDGKVQIGDMLLSGVNVNTVELLGVNMQAWYRHDSRDADENVLLYMHPDTGRGKVLKVNSYDIESFEMGTLQYSESGRIKKEVFPKGIYILYNGVSVSDYTGWDIKCDNGSVSLIDNNNDGKYDVLSIFDYDESVVYAKTSDKIICDLHSAERNIDLSDDRIKYYKDGAAAAYEDIRAYDVLSALRTKNGKIIAVVITTNAVKGKITSMAKSTQHGCASEVVINSTDFFTLESFEKAFDNEIKLNLEGTFYLDFNGNIVGFTKGEDNSLYAYVIKIAADSRRTDDVYLKLFTQDGAIKNFLIPDRFTLNGKPCKDSAKVFDCVRASAVIKYRTDENGDIKWLETAYNNTDALNPENSKDTYLNYGDSAPEDRLRVTYSKQGDTETYINAVGMLGDKARVSNKTIFFKVPKDITVDDEIFFGVGKRNMLTDAQKVEFQTYASSRNSIDNDVCVIFENTNYSGNSFLKQVPVGFIEKVYTAVSDEGDKTTIKIRSNTGSATLAEYDEGYFSKIKAQKTSITGTFSLQKGDIIRYILNSNGSVVYAELLYRFSDGKILDYNSGQGVVDDFCIRMGYVYKRQDENVALVNSEPDGGTTRADWKVFNMEKAKVYIFENNELRAGTLDDVVSYDANPGDYSKGVLHSMWGQPQVFYIYK